MNIIQEVIALYNESESPQTFFYWSTLAALSAVARRNVWINKRGVYKLYPCMYIMLVGKSGIKKGLPVKVAKKLVDATDSTRVIDGRSSIQAMIEDLGHQKTSPNDELGSLLVKDPHAQLILTTLFDCFYHDKWPYRTKSGGEVIIKEPGVTLLTASNKAHLDEFLDPDSIIGGFIGRTNIVHADSGNPSGSDLLGESDEDDKNIQDIDLTRVIEHLKNVSKVVGQFKITPDARMIWKSWYKEIRDSVDSGGLDDETGTIQRIHDNALKVAMLLSLAERFDLVINEAHMNEAIQKCEESFESVRMITSGKGKSEEADKTNVLLAYLLDQDDFTASRKKILQTKWKDIDGITLTKIVDTIGPTGAGIIEVRNSPTGLTYSIEKKWASRFKQKMNKGRVIVNE
jgi:hypothetical protein